MLPINRNMCVSFLFSFYIAIIISKRKACVKRVTGGIVQIAYVIQKICQNASNAIGIV